MLVTLFVLHYTRHQGGSHNTDDDGNQLEHQNAAVLHHAVLCGAVLCTS